MQRISNCDEIQNEILTPDESTEYSTGLQDMAFFQSFAHISGTTGRIFMKILSEMYLWTRMLLLNFGSRTYLNQILTGSALVVCAL